jgi:hypothetical protein
MAKIRVNHFASKTIDSNNTVDWESLLSEILIAFFLAVFAYMGYSANIRVLFFLCAFSSLAIVLSWCCAGVLKVKEKYFNVKSDDIES